MKKICSQTFYQKSEFSALWCLHVFLPNFKSRFCKMDIFLFFKNVQNEKLPTNLDRPFFGGIPNLGFYISKNIKNKINLLIYYKSFFK